MKIIPFPDRQNQQTVKFRCYTCRVAFTPTSNATTHCEQCTAGMALYSAVVAYRRAENQRGRT
jgi:hypothetical protein